MLTQLATFLALAASGGKALENGLGIKPVLGWNSWNYGGCSASTAGVVLRTAKAFEDHGLKDLGYKYLVVDDCWSQLQRDSSGSLQPDPAKFPNGIDGLAKEIQGMGLKLGLYGDAGTRTCALYPGSYGHEQKDADTLATWGVDYWKYDNCQTEGPYTNKGINSSHYYPIMRDALLKTGKPILFSMCQWGLDQVWTWAGNVGNSWRISPDIKNSWASVASIAAKAASISQYSGPGRFNDLDIMELGNGILTEAEERAHFGLWVIMKSPILLSTDMTKLKDSTLNIIKNKAILAVHQDSLGKAATTFTPKGHAPATDKALYPYFAGRLSDGVVIGLVAVDGAATLTADFIDVPGLGPGSFEWTELYSGRTGTGTSVSQSLGPHDMAIFKVVKPTA